MIVVLDVESVGLHGEGFAVGLVVRDRAKREVFSQYLGCPIETAKGSDEDRQWVLENVYPHLPPPNCENPREVRDRFWTTWMRFREQGCTLWADCGWPVEDRFLAACVDDDLSRKWQGPYPRHEIASVLWERGLDPTGTYDRLADELPAHNPVNDARQSARLLLG